MALSREQQLRILGNMKESDINYSDIPKTNAEFWKNAELLIPPEKTRISIRIDNDILSWFKERQEEGYQTLINLVLRHYMTSIKNEGSKDISE
jgi:uncharacterized protein (DUF4415 family)